MAKKIGILVLGDQDWIGGLYYSINLIKAFDYLDEARQPTVYAFYGNLNAKKELDLLSYSKLVKVDYNTNFLSKVLSKLWREFFHVDIKAKALINKYELDVLYPYNYNCSVKTNKKVIAWFPDFQHKFLPHHFSQAEISKRDRYLTDVDKRMKHLVFSSQTALNQFKSFYPNAKISTYVYSFISAINLNLIDAAIPKNKFNLNKNYFIVSNQFWKHKNHLVVVKALEYLKKEQEINFDIVFTGKQNDGTSQEYFDSILEIVKSANLNEHVHFLGFIDRYDQLSILSQAMAVIQPSSFEGWSTVIEDAKTLNKQVFASDIEIHREQLGTNGYFFDQNDVEQLAKLLGDFNKGNIKKNCNYLPFKNRAEEAALNLNKILS